MGMTGDSVISAEARFREVFAHLPEVVAYARRRGSRDPEAIGAEALTIAWRKLADVPRDDARPWLYATARNLGAPSSGRHACRSTTTIGLSRQGRSIR